MRKGIGRSSLLALTLMLAGCSGYWTAQEKGTKSLGNGTVLLTSADLRGIMRTPSPGSSITCAEPSPDIARAVQAALSADLAAQAEGLQGVDPKIAASLGMARSEGLMQLGRRLATTQVLRDGLYRACEAYANNAITPASYAMILSRLDDVLVTLLLAEFAAGGLQSASVSAIAPGNVETSAEAATEKGEEPAQDEAATSQEDTPATSEPATSEPATSEPATSEPATSAPADTTASGASGSADTKSTAKVTLGTSQMIAPTSTTGPDSASNVAAAMVVMQQGYLDDFNLDAIMIGCLSALEGARPGEAGFRRLCESVVTPEAMKGVFQLKAADVLMRASKGQDINTVAGRAKALRKLSECFGGDATQC